MNLLKLFRVNKNNNKNKSLKQGLLFVTLLFVLSFILNLNIVTKSYAMTQFEEGDVVTITISNGISYQYTLQGELIDGQWINVKTTNAMYYDGDLVNGSSFANILGKAWITDHHKFGVNDGKLKDLCSEIADVLVSCGVVDEKVGKKIFNLRGSQDATDLEAATALLTDEALFDYLVNDENTAFDGYKSISVYNSNDDIPKQTGNNYSGLFKIENKIIYAVIYDKAGVNEITSFKIGTVSDDEKSYQEKTYTNDYTNLVKLKLKSDAFKLTNDTKDGNVGNAMYFTKSGETIDKYKSQLDACKLRKKDFSTTALVLMKDPTANQVVLYSANQGRSGEAVLSEELRLSLEALDELFEDKTQQILVGDWKYEIDKSLIIKAYKEGDVEDNYYYYDFSKAKRMYVKDNDYIDLFVPCKKGKTHSFNYNYPTQKDFTFTILRATKKPDRKDKDDSTGEVNAEFLEFLGDPACEVYACTVSLKQQNAAKPGYKYSDKLKLSELNKDGSEPDGEDYPPDFPLSDLLGSDKDTAKKIQQQQRNSLFATVNIDVNLGDTKKTEKQDFLRDLFTYGRIILLFLILLAIVYTAILSIQSAMDVEKRVLIKTRLKNILIGAIIFACAVPMFGIILSFTQDAYEDLGEIVEDYSGPTYNATVTRYQSGWIVNFVGKFVRLYATLCEWLVDEVLKMSIEPGTPIELMQLIYDVYDDDGTVSSIMPFTDGEWAAYMYGYRLLATVSICLIAIGLVKLAGDIILSSGNYQKIAECKEQMKNIIFTIIGIVLVPYCYRLLLLLFNYLTAMLPIDADTAQFDIDFNCTGFVGAIADAMFVTMKLKIYITFFVRKVMLAFMLIASPVILGMKCISPKFRGFSIWMGESLSQAATQFCYAMVMLVVILITYEGQSPFMILIIVTIMPKMVSFFSRSLQGFAQRWGGINTDGIANQIVSGLKGAGGRVKKGFKNTGRTLQKGAAFFDKDGVSKTGRNVHNIGALMQGRPLDMRTKREMYSNRAAVAYDEAAKASQDVRQAKADAKPWLNDPEMKKYYDQRTEDRKTGRESNIQTGTGYDQINDLVDKESDLEFKQNRYQWFDGQKNTYGDEGLHIPMPDSLQDGINDSKKLKTTKAVIRQGIDALNYGPISAMQRKASGYKTVSDPILDKEAKAIQDATKIDFINTSELVNDVSSMQAMAMEAIKSGTSAHINFGSVDTSQTLDRLGALLSKDSAPTVAKLDTAKELIKVMANFEMIKQGGQIDDGMLESMQKVTQSYADRITDSSDIPKDLKDARQVAVTQFAQVELEHARHVEEERLAAELEKQMQAQRENDIRKIMGNGGFDPTSTSMGFGESGNAFNDAGEQARFGEGTTAPGFKEDGSIEDQVGGRFTNVNNIFMGDEEGSDVGESIITASNSPKGTQRIITGYESSSTGRGEYSRNDTVEMILEGTGINVPHDDKPASSSSGSGYSEQVLENESGEIEDDVVEDIMKEETKKKTTKEIESGIDSLLSSFKDKKGANKNTEAKEVVRDLITLVSEAIEDKHSIDLTSTDLSDARYEGERREERLREAVNAIKEVYPDVTLEYLEAHAHEIVQASRGGVSETHMDHLKMGHQAERNIDAQKTTQKPH